MARTRLEDVARPLIARVSRPEVIRRLIVLPSLPAFFRRRYAAHRGAWPARKEQDLPEHLRTVPGIWRNPEAEREAFESDPLHDFAAGNASALTWLYTHMWRSVLPVAPRLSRARALVQRISSSSAAGTASRQREGSDDARLTAELKARAADLGLSAVGVAAYDQRYEFVEYHDQKVGDRVVVCVLEQNYESTQAIPSSRAEQAALSAYAEIMTLATELAQLLVDRGYRVTVHGPEGQNVAIHYGVEAGLGQLGLNGQLLTPMAGSRCRLLTINTDAPLEVDHPVDYGIHAICDACKACVRRCPVSAIPGKRRWYRGVLKSKLDTERCLPLVAQASGCSICMKVCPIQKYGLDPVVEHFEKTGKIMGRGTDELEGYDWPLDGRHYSPGQQPELHDDFRRPPGVVIHPHPKGVDPEADGRLWS